ncbi:phage tail tape measure protein [Bacillus sp. A301a_S52]|nr:phage tail tape measure protein [Bacillus sp. A301a_S52]
MSSQDIGTLRTRLAFEDDGSRGLQGFKDDLRGLRSEMNVARSSGREYTNSLRGMRDQSDILTRRLQVQRQQVQELRRRYQESARTKGENAKQTENLRNQYNNALASMNRTEQQLKQLTAELRRQESPWQRLSVATDHYGRQMQTIGRGITSFGRSWSMYVTTPILGAAGAALKVGMDFQEGMSQVQAISGATGSQLAQLEEQAKEMGSTTRFSATEAASGMEFLARAGFEVNEITESMPGLLDLAASANMDLGRAADITSNILSGFGYEASEAGRIADVLAKASATANTDVNGLGQAMEVVAPVAATLSVDMEDLAAAVGTMADAGIDGSQAGRMLRQGMLRLANPTGQAADIIEELGINVFDAEGNMKSMPNVVDELGKGLDGMSADARTAALATIFGAESTAGWSALLERGASDLDTYTKELKNSEGAASDMAAVMEDNAKGAIREFRSALEGVGIAASEHMIPAVTSIIERATDLIRTFGDLSHEQQEQIVKWGLIAAAVGPAAVVLGNLITTLGGVLRAISLVAGAIAAKGGLIAALGALSGPVGWTIAGVAALAGGIYLWSQRSEEAEKANLDLAHSMIEQHQNVAEMTEAYETLRRKSGLTTKEFGRMLDIQKEMAKTADQSKLDKLQEELDGLQEKSLLSNDELDRMVSLNDALIEKVPESADHISEQGNRIIDNIGYLEDYNKELADATLRELERQRLIAEGNEREIRKEINDLHEELVEGQEREKELREELRDFDREASEARIEEIEKMLEKEDVRGREAQALRYELKQEEEKLTKYNDQLVKQMEKNDETQKAIDQKEEELGVMDEIDNAVAGVLLAQLGVNEAGKDGIKLAEERLVELRKERDVVKERLDAEGDVSGEIQRHLDDLDKKIGLHESVLGQVEKETDLSSDLLGKEKRRERLIELQALANGKVYERMQEIRTGQDKINDFIRIGTGEAEKMNEKLGKDIKKDVDVDDDGTAKKISEEASKSETKKVTLRATALQGFQAVLGSAMSRIRGYATGTDYHPGGLFMAGEEGIELGRMGNHWELLGPGFYNRPAGYEVFPHNESKKILSSLNKMPAYATGARPTGEAQRVVNQMNRQERAGTIHQHITINSPAYTPPSENARLLKQASRQLAMEAGF